MIALSKEIIATLIALFIFFIFVQLAKRLVRKFIRIKHIDVNRRKVILNIVYLCFYIIFASSMAIIWGVDLKQFTVFISSILAVLGVGFFAQWSILSNLTASVILFLNHPLRIGDRIRVLDKDFDWSGEVKDITGFYLFMKTDKNENISIPTSIVMQKGIEILGPKENEIEDETQG